MAVNGFAVPRGAKYARRFSNTPSSVRSSARSAARGSRPIVSASRAASPTRSLLGTNVSASARRIASTGRSVAPGARLRQISGAPQRGDDTTMPTSKAMAVWEGRLRDGKGTFKAGSAAFGGAYSFATRFEGKAGTNPEELIAAAHAACFSMALSAGLGKAGKPGKRGGTSAAGTVGTGDGAPDCQCVLSIRSEAAPAQRR